MEAEAGPAEAEAEAVAPRGARRAQPDNPTPTPPDARCFIFLQKIKKKGTLLTITNTVGWGDMTPLDRKIERVTSLTFTDI